LNVVNRAPRRVCVPKRAEEDTYFKNYIMTRSLKIRSLRETLLRQRNYKVWSKNAKCTSRNHLGVSGAVAKSIKVDFQYIGCGEQGRG